MKAWFEKTPALETNPSEIKGPQNTKFLSNTVSNAVTAVKAIVGLTELLNEGQVLLNWILTEDMKFIHQKGRYSVWGSLYVCYRSYVLKIKP